MVNTNKIRGMMAEKNISGEKMAEIMGISSATFYRKMKIRKFDSDEMKIFVDVLDISDPTPVFFTD